MEKITVKNFFLNILKGMLMGMALIIPGFSGGTVAVVLGVYYGLVSAVSGLLSRDFVRNFLFLLPFAIGMVLAVALLIIPIRTALEYLPLPTICLFVGLMLGGVPPIAKDAGKPNKFAYILSFAIACAVAVGICFLPMLDTVDEAADPGVGTYFALFGVGVVGACGFVVPGISGSMILMVLGFYNYILGAGESLLKLTDIGHNLLIILVFAAGVLVGFFIISFIMKQLLTHCKRGTYYAILGFIAGSVFTLFYQQYDSLIMPDMSAPLQITLAVLLALVGFAASFVFCVFTERKKLRDAQTEERPAENASDGEK